MPYFGYSRYPMKVRTRSIIRLASSALRSPSGRARKRSSTSCSFAHASCRPCSKRRSTGAWLEVLDVAEDHGHERGGAFAPTRPRDVDLADAAHAVLVEEGPDGVSRLPPAGELGQLVQEVLVLDVFQEGHHLRMRADHVRDIQERQPHLRRDVVGDGLRERVGRVLLAQPRLQLLVQPPRGLHRPHEHLMAPRIEQDPLQLLDVRQDEVEQRRSGLRPDVALQRGDGSLAAPDQLGDDGRIGLDRGRRVARRRDAGALVRERRDEVVAFEDGLQRVPDQRIGFPQDLEEGCAARRRSQALR